MITSTALAANSSRNSKRVYWFSPVQMTVLLEALHLRQRADILGGDGFFQPEQAQRFDRFRQRDRRRQVELTVTVNRQIDFVADGVADAFDQADDVGHLFRASRPVIGIELARAGVIHVELDGAEALPDDFERFLGVGLDIVLFAGVTVGIEANVARGTCRRAACKRARRAPCRQCRRGRSRCRSARRSAGRWMSRRSARRGAVSRKSG